jgi:hypothetical protein
MANVILRAPEDVEEVKHVSIARLVIYPDDVNFIPQNRDSIQRALSAIEFTGSTLPSDDDSMRFLIGEQFLNFVTFLGCSPAIEIEPPEDGSEDFCHIHISPIHQQAEFCADAAGKGPRCPHCRYEEKNWQALAEQWRGNNAIKFQCPECQQATDVIELNWRKSAVAAHLFIEIYSVFPNEAVLADKVLSVLEQATGVAWKYFYSR